MGDNDNEVDGDCYEEITDAPVEKEQTTEEVGCYEEPTTPEPKQETTEAGCYEEPTTPEPKQETTEVGCVDDLTEAPVEKEQTTEAVGCEDDAVTQPVHKKSYNQRNHRKNSKIAVPQLDGMF